MLFCVRVHRLSGSQSVVQWSSRLLKCGLQMTHEAAPRIGDHLAGPLLYHLAGLPPLALLLALHCTAICTFCRVDNLQFLQWVLCPVLSAAHCLEVKCVLVLKSGASIGRSGRPLWLWIDLVWPQVSPRSSSSKSMIRGEILDPGSPSSSSKTLMRMQLGGELHIPDPSS